MRTSKRCPGCGKTISGKKWRRHRGQCDHRARGRRFR